MADQPKKHLIYYLLTAVVALVLLEGFAFVAVQLVDKGDFFDARERTFTRIEKADLVAFFEERGDSTTGWRNIGPRVRKLDNCQGVQVEYSYDASGAREHQWFDRENTRILAVGDSYTLGNEVADDLAYPAQLSRALGESVANYGVGGYGPTQSLLKLRQLLPGYPATEAVVLGIMYENVYRMVNRFRPVLYGESSYFTLKPYMSGGQIVPHPGPEPFVSHEAFRPWAEDAFDHDFWAKPVAKFPYLLALGRSLASNYTYYRKFQREFRKLGLPEYALIYRDAEIERNLLALLQEYAVMAKQWDIRPVVVFIPRNRLDTESVSGFLERNRPAIDSRLVVGDVGQLADIDWEKFNLQEPGSDNVCHPSPYGYRVIAEYVAGLLRADT